MDILGERRESLQQEAFLGFFRRCLGYLIDYLKISRDEIWLQITMTLREDYRRVECLLWIENNSCYDILLSRSTGRRGYSIDKHICYHVALGNRCLNKCRVDEVSFVADAATLAIVEEEPAFLVSMTYITAAQPSGAGLLRRGTFVIKNIRR